MTQEELRRLARIGAEARLRELERELQTIRSTFPELGGARPRRGRRRKRVVESAAAARPARQGRRSNMSAAARKRIADAQRKRWAEWRKQREGKK